MKRKIVYTLFVLLTLLNGCTREKEIETGGRTVLVYMVASNLTDYLDNNIQNMIKVASAKNLNGGKLIVFFSRNQTSAELFEIREGAGGVVTRLHIRDYENKSALLPSTMREVIDEVVQLYPNRSYGLAFSSHGTAWLPANHSLMPRSFGEENGRKMEIYDVAAALPDHLFDFLIFDACSMGAVECVYELRNKANCIVASPSETMRYGFPYEKLLPYLFTKEANLEKVAEQFYLFYRDEFGDGYQQYPYGNISVTKTGELEALAALVHEIVESAGGKAMFAPPYPDWQVLTYLPSAPTKLYDLDDVIKSIATGEQYVRFTALMQKAVTDKYATASMYSSQAGSLPVERFSGLSVYPLQEPLTQLNEWYKRLEWYKAVYE
jgi:hypothetical protein